MRIASPVVPGTLGVIVAGGLTFLLVLSSWSEPGVGDARRPKPTFGSSSRTTFTICCPYRILDTERLLLHDFFKGASAFRSRR